MYRRARLAALASLCAISLANNAAAQVVVQPTPTPVITAENERWYLNGEPITYAGNIYYPAGPAIYFNANEMIRSGFYLGIPLYTRTTVEPYSMVYVPLGNARMQPYERLRIGEVAQPQGSIASTVPVPAGQLPVAGSLPQAQGPPMQTTRVIPVEVLRPVGTTGVEPRVEPSSRPVATAGRLTVRATQRPVHTRIGGRPQGTNSVFIEYRSERWYKAGDAAPIDTSRLQRVGDYMGIAVWADSIDSAIIYVPVTRGTLLAVPYSRRKQ